MDIIITLKAEPKLLKAIDVLVDCLQAQGTLAASLTSQTATVTNIEATPVMEQPVQTQPATQAIPDPVQKTAAILGQLTRLLYPQATGHAPADLGPPDAYLQQVERDFLGARGKTRLMELTDAADLEALLYTLQGAAAQRTATQQYVAPVTPAYQNQNPEFQSYVAPITPPAPPAPPTYAPPVSPIPTAAPTYSMDQLAVAATGLVDAGKVGDLMTLLGQYGCQALTQLPTDQYGSFATAMRGLGAQI